MDGADEPERDDRGGERIVRYAQNAGVAILTWNTAHRNNAWGPDLEGAYFAALRRAADDVDVRAIVVTGAGRHFCPGTDVAQLSATADGDHSTDPDLREPMTTPMTIPKPIVAAIHGACAGSGFVQAAMCDVRFADPDARITSAFARRGIMAEHGLSVLLPSLIGMANAFDLLISGRVLSAGEAHAVGFVNQVSSPGAVVGDAVAYAQGLAEHCSPIAMALMKQQLYERIGAALEDARLQALRMWRRLREHADFREGVDSFTQRRAPDFAGLTSAGFAAYLAQAQVTGAAD